MELIKSLEKNDYLLLKNEILQLKKEVGILRASTRFAIDNIREMQGKETMTETIKKMKDATKMKVVPNDIKK